MKVLLLDDHVLVREAMRGVIAELQPEAERYRGGDVGRRPVA